MKDENNHRSVEDLLSELKRKNEIISTLKQQINDMMLTASDCAGVGQANL